MASARHRLHLTLLAALLAVSCADERGPERSATPAGSSAEVFDGGRDPFGSENASQVASGKPPAEDEMRCDNFSLTIVGPFVQTLGARAEFRGHAQDDQRHAFALSWSASAGELTDKSGSKTTYTCTEPGVHTITMIAALETVCSSAIAHVVTCLSPLN